MIEVFKALSEESRLRILSLLFERDMCVCEIEACLQMTQSNVSRHLTALKNCGILESYKKAQWVYYRVNQNFMEENQQLGEYLKMKLKEMSTYQTDYKKSMQCKDIELCKLKKTKKETEL